VSFRGRRGGEERSSEQLSELEVGERERNGPIKVRQDHERRVRVLVEQCLDVEHLSFWIGWGGGLS
jgi:hypothetical protein